MSMTNTLNVSSQVLSLLEGMWIGEGRGEYPTVTSFDYRETLTFTRRDEKTLAYEQRAQKRYDGQTDWLVSHWESGFLRILENGELELTSAQVGRSEVLVGSVISLDTVIRIHFVSKTITNDPRVLASARTIELEGDTLRYEMEMQTTKVDQLTQHLKITLQRIR
jgi:hypothetical protein